MSSWIETVLSTGLSVFLRGGPILTTFIFLVDEVPMMDQHWMLAW